MARDTHLLIFYKISNSTWTLGSVLMLKSTTRSKLLYGWHAALSLSSRMWENKSPRSMCPRNTISGLRLAGSLELKGAFVNYKLILKHSSLSGY